MKVQAEKTGSGFQKAFLRISLCICRISLQPLIQNDNKKFQKLYFDFGYCKLPESAGCLTAFKCFFGLYIILVVVLIVQP